MADKNFTPSWNSRVGLNYTPAYEVSGIPFARGGINCNQGSAVKIEFPSVTMWIIIINHGNALLGNRDVKVAFSEASLSSKNFFIVPRVTIEPNRGTFPIPQRLEVKVSEIWLQGSENVDVIAGLTRIVPASVSTSAGASWKGSTGVG